MKKQCVNILKVGIAIAIIAYLLQSGKIDVHAVMASFKNKLHFILLSILFSFCAFLVSVYRWQIILVAETIIIPFWNVLKMSFTGMFFNLAVPGMVGGDVVKLYYVGKYTKIGKSITVMTVLLDRVIGFFGLILFSFIMALLNWDIVRVNPALYGLARFSGLMLLGFALFFALSFSRMIREHRWINGILLKLPFSAPFFKVYDALHLYRHKKNVLLQTILLTLIIQLLAITSVFMCSLALQFDGLSPGVFYFIVPLGLMITALPISPQGIGVGQAAFLTLFNVALGTSSTIGADISTLCQFVAIFINFCGIFFYLSSKKHDPNLPLESTVLQS